MKRIIKGRRYDTDAPHTTLVAENSSGEYCTDFRFWSERLYRTGQGSWFVAGEGGAMTQWSQPAEGGGRVGGSGIRPLTPEEAMEWLETVDTVEAVAAIETHFGDKVEVA